MPDHNQGGQSPSDPRLSSHSRFGWGPPFGHDVGGKIPICGKGQIIYVTPFEYLWYFIHGASPARDCFLRTASSGGFSRVFRELICYGGLRRGYLRGSPD